MRPGAVLIAFRPHVYGLQAQVRPRQREGNVKRLATAALAAALMTWPAHGAEVKDLAAEGKALMQQFGGALKSELTAAVDKGGPVEAIGVCNMRAPEIAAEIAGASDGWTIVRSSHKLRNSGNAPDAYTAKTIAAFLEREAAGEAAAEIAKAEIVEEDGQRVFRMVKAIPTAAVCLTCHGTAVAPEVEAALQNLYPDDNARGFAEGDMRGVFSLRKPLN